MQIFKTKEKVEYYFSEHPLGFEMAKQLFQSVKQIEEVKNSGFQDMKACVILTDSDKELELIYKRYGLSDTTFECKDTFKSGGISWVKQVHVIDDSGDGIIIFQKFETCT